MSITPITQLAKIQNKEPVSLVLVLCTQLMARCHPLLHRISEIFSASLFMFFLQQETQLKQFSSGSEVSKLSITFRAPWRKTNKCKNEETMESLKFTLFPLTNQMIDTNQLLRFTLKDDCKTFWQLNEVECFFYIKIVDLGLFLPWQMN